MNRTLSLSTSWHYKRSENGTDLIAKAVELGFDNMELNFHIKQKVFEDIKRSIADFDLRISSLHNICPVTPEMEKVKDYSNFFSFSVKDKEIRKKAVELSERTLVNAAEFDAKPVVFHLGEAGEGELRIEEKEFAKPFKKELKKNQTVTDFFDGLLEKREAIKAPYLDNVRRCLDYLVPVAEKLGVVIGIENRYYISQIPNFDEVGVLLDEYDSPHIGFWYDSGHAANISNLGYWDYLEWLKAYKSRLVAVHLHDCRAAQDHLPPGSGDIDWSELNELLPADILCTLELNPSTPEENLIEGVNYLRDEIKLIKK
ncbi:MAG: TIM barrel protein [candidate division Zixibacteria bacterium]|nr:TIM barrel protein [candidate division Zixibacteria bacterium]